MNARRLGQLIGKARASTAEQEARLETQIRELKPARCRKMFREQVSSIGAREQFDRPSTICGEGTQWS
jgi:hypothetical protein